MTGAPTDALETQRGIRSLETGGVILRALADAAEPVKLRDLADVVGIVPSKLHPYLVSLRKVGMAEQTGTGRYSLEQYPIRLNHKGST